MTYRLDITATANDRFPVWWPNYLTENNLWSSATATMQEHLLDNYNCQFCHISDTADTYERWLEFANDEDRVMFVLRYS